MKTVETTVYKFSELSEKAKDKALEKLYDINVDYDWAECTIDMFTEILEKIGVSNSEISYSGFSSQGDGLSFTGSYSYKKGCYKAIVKEFPEWKELRSEVKNLCDLQKKYFYKVTGNIVRMSHNYSHVNTVEFDIAWDTEYKNHTELTEEFTEIFRSIMQEFYSTLEKEYEYLTGRDAIIESIEANDYDFTIEGKIWH